MVQNRLEQLRKRQRDEALQAQQELLAGVPTPTRPLHARGNPTIDLSQTPIDGANFSNVDNIPELYYPEMSPQPVDASLIPPEQREIEVIDSLTDRLNLVSFFKHFPYQPDSVMPPTSSRNAEQLHLPDSFRVLVIFQRKSKALLFQV